MTKQTSLNNAAFWPVVLLSLFILWNAPGVFAAPVGGIPGIRNSVQASRRNEISKILWVLEYRRSNKQVLEKAADKLFEMNERQLRLVSSLCDRITEDNSTAGADIAFSLVTAMIVLS
jgi:hypothetical protein